MQLQVRRPPVTQDVRGGCRRLEIRRFKTPESPQAEDCLKRSEAIERINEGGPTGNNSKGTAEAVTAAAGWWNRSLAAVNRRRTTSNRAAVGEANSRRVEGAN